MDPFRDFHVMVLLFFADIALYQLCDYNEEEK